MIRVGDLFAGGGGSSLGAIAADCTVAWAIEADPQIAAVYAANLGDHVIVCPLQDLDPVTLEPVDVLLASPPCPAFSTARSRTLAPRDDGWLGLAIIPYLEALRPRVFVLENVPPYLTTGWPILSQIVACLWRLGYVVDWSIVNAADYGVPQTRSRLFVRATRDGLLPPWPAPLPWVGWYQEIADLIPTLPESRLAPWQAKRLSAHPVYGSVLLHTFSHSDAIPRPFNQPAFTTSASQNPSRALLVHPTADNDRFVAREEGEPAFTVLGASGTYPRALLVDNRNSGSADGDRPITIRTAAQPSPTLSNVAKGGLRAMLVSGTDATVREEHEPSTTINGQTGCHTVPSRLVLEEMRCVLLTMRALARLQGFPDSYVLPEKGAVAGKILGNAVPPPVMTRILHDLIASSCKEVSA